LGFFGGAVVASREDEPCQLGNGADSGVVAFVLLLLLFLTERGGGIMTEGKDMDSLAFWGMVAI
jgi:hypothetical protein